MAWLDSICNEAWGKWKNVFLNILNKHAPKKIIRVGNKTAPSEVRRQMLSRDYLKTGESSEDGLIK